MAPLEEYDRYNPYEVTDEIRDLIFVFLDNPSDNEAIEDVDESETRDDVGDNGVAEIVFVSNRTYGNTSEVIKNAIHQLSVKDRDGETDVRALADFNIISHLP